MISLGTPVAAVDNRHYTFEFLESCSKPKLFVSGAHDQYGSAPSWETLVDSIA